MSGERSGGARSRKGHVTATDNADTDALIAEVGYALRGDPGERDQARKSIARFLADKREEWLLCAMVRVEREFRVKRKAPSGGDRR